MKNDFRQQLDQQQQLIENLSIKMEENQRRSEETSQALENLSKRTLKLESQQSFSPREFLYQPLPEVRDTSPSNGSTSNSPLRRSVPVGLISENPQFRENQIAFIESCEFSDSKRVNKIPVPSIYEVGSEGELQFIVSKHVYGGLNSLAENEIETRHGDEFGAITKADGISKLLVDGKPGRSIVIYELKRRNVSDRLIQHGNNLVTALRYQERVVVDAFEQTVGYLYSENVCWGVLTTYQRSWAIQVIRNGSVLNLACLRVVHNWIGLGIFDALVCARDDTKG